MFEQLLLQIATDVIGSATGLVSEIAVLIGGISGLIIAIISKRSVNREKTQREKETIALAKAFQIGSQKTIENIGQVRQVAGALYDLLELTPEQRKYAEEKIKPILDDTTTRMSVGNQQIAIVKGILLAIMGNSANVESDANFPRESRVLSEKLRNIC